MPESIVKMFKELQPLCDSVHEGICIYEVIFDDTESPIDFRIIEANAPYERITGLSQKITKGNLLSKTAAPPDGSLIELLQDVTLHQNYKTVELYWPLVARHIKISAIALNKKICATIVSDVSELKNKIEELRESQIRYQSLFNRYPIGLIISRVDDGKIVRCNDYVAKMLGYPSQELCLAQYSAQKHYVNPKERRKIVTMLQEKGMFEDFEIEMKDCNGKRFWISYSARKENDIIEGAAVVITEKKVAERQLQESEERYRILANATYEAMVISCKGKIIELSRQFETIYGYTKQEVVEKGIAQLVHPDDRERVMENIRNNVCGPYRHRGIKKDGTVLYLEIRADTIFINGEEHRLTIIRDITELTTIQEQLSQAEKMRAIGQLAGGIAHDFNNQLAGIVGYADILHEELADNPELLYYIDNIIHSSKKSSDLTAQLLAFARKGKYLSYVTDLHEVITGVIDILERTIDRRITIEKRFEATLPVVSGDPTQLQNAVMNIALNARDAMSEGGVLHFSTSTVDLDEQYCRLSTFDIKPDRFIQVAITDTGIGMDSETQKKIFEPFFTTKEHGKGTGMGLASVYGIVKNHNGEITVKSEPGKGTTLILLLPQSAIEHTSTKVSSQDKNLSLSSGNTCILLVDDEEIIRNAAAAIIQKGGYEIIQCCNGREALSIYREKWQSIDLVLLDMVMPVMDGRETFHEMKKINPHIRVLLNSGYSIDGEAQQIIDDGAVDFIQKPFRRTELLGKIAETLNR